MTTHKLMIKTHKITNIKYLCYTKKEGKEYDNYLGSGKRWKKILKNFGTEIKTDLIYESENLEEFKSKARELSEKYDIVNSPDWANLKIEEGEGGDTVSNKIWITNGTIDKYLLKENEIPYGWRRGRTN